MLFLPFEMWIHLDFFLMRMIFFSVKFVKYVTQWIKLDVMFYVIKLDLIFLCLLDLI